jgi:hypothetical protein
MTELYLTRTRFGPHSTIGELTFDDDPVRFCYTLEDVVRSGPKVPGETAIPAGRYRVVMTLSARFGVVLPLLLDVPGFEGIRIHAGNTSRDTAGCPLVGLEEHRSEYGDTITHSRLALAALLQRLQGAVDMGDEIWISVR